MIISKDDEQFLISRLDNTKEYLKSDSVNEILLPLDEWISMNGFDENYDLTDEGRKAQQIYDRIYENNT